MARLRPRHRRPEHPAFLRASPDPDRRPPFDKSRAARVQRAMAATKVGLSDVAYFDNMLVDDKAARKAKHDFMLRVFDAAVLLGTDAVCGFVGRNIRSE